MGAGHAVHTNIHSLHEARQAIQQMKLAIDTMVMENNVYNNSVNLSNANSASNNAIAVANAQAILMHQIFGM